MREANASIGTNSSEASWLIISQLLEDIVDEAVQRSQNAPNQKTLLPDLGD